MFKRLAWASLGAHRGVCALVALRPSTITGTLTALRKARQGLHPCWPGAATPPPHRAAGHGPRRHLHQGLPTPPSFLHRHRGQACHGRRRRAHATPLRRLVHLLVVHRGEAGAGAAVGASGHASALLRHGPRPGPRRAALPPRAWTPTRRAAVRTTGGPPRTLRTGTRARGGTAGLPPRRPPQKRMLPKRGASGAPCGRGPPPPSAS